MARGITWFLLISICLLLGFKIGEDRGRADITHAWQEANGNRDRVWGEFFARECGWPP